MFGKQFISSLIVFTLFAVGSALANTKIGMITTLSGGGAGLGIDVRDGFMLAIAQAKRADLEVIIADDQRKADIAVKLADKMIQADKVDVLTGIIWSNLAMAVVPSVTAQGKFYLSPNAGPSQLAGKGCHPNYFNVAWQMIICMKRLVPMQMGLGIKVALFWRQTTRQGAMR